MYRDDDVISTAVVAADSMVAKDAAIPVTKATQDKKDKKDEKDKDKTDDVPEETPIGKFL